MALLESALIVIAALSFGIIAYTCAWTTLGALAIRKRKLQLGATLAKSPSKSEARRLSHSSIALMLVSVTFKWFEALPNFSRVVHRVGPVQKITAHYDLLCESERIGTVFFWQLLTAVAITLVLALACGPFSILVGAALVIAPSLVLSSEYKKSQRAMREQLIILVEDLADSLKAGKSLSQALQMCTGHIGYPMKTHVEKASSLIACGVPADRAFAQAMESAVVTEAQTLSAALQIQYRTGGNLMVLLAEFASQFRQALLFEQNLQTQTAQGRLSVKVVAIIPPILIVIMNVISPSYLDCFLSSTLGRGLFVGAIALDLCGLLMVNKMMTISEIQGS